MPSLKLVETEEGAVSLHELLHMVKLYFEDLESKKAVIRDKKGNTLDCKKVAELIGGLNSLLKPYVKGEQLCQNKRQLN